MNQDVFLNKLRDSDKRVSLFIGTAINPETIPQWKGLVDNLLDSSIRRLLSDFHYEDSVKDIRDWIKEKYSVYEQGNFIVNGLGNDYIELVHHALFRDFTHDQLAKQDTNLDIIARICLLSRIDSVVTYNYDNLLEEKIRLLGGRNVVSQYGAKLRPTPVGSLPVYHTHGFLPWKTLSLVDNDIVFGLEEYHRQYVEQSNWQTTTQLHILENHFCIFLCTSLSDIDMLKLRSLARQYSNNTDVYHVHGVIRTETDQCFTSHTANHISDNVRNEISRIHSNSLGIEQITILCPPDFKRYRDFLESILFEINSTF